MTDTDAQKHSDDHEQLLELCTAIAHAEAEIAAGKGVAIRDIDAVAQDVIRLFHANTTGEPSALPLTPSTRDFRVP